MGYSTLQKGLIIVAYVTLNKCINLLNKYLLGSYGFAFPLFVSACHQAFCFAGLAPAMCLQRHRPAHRRSLQEQWRGLLAVSAFFACSLALNNYSLTSIPLSLNQVIRASLPVVTALLAIGIEGIRPSRQEMVSLWVLTGGVMLAIYEGSQQRTSLAGLAACVAGTLTNGCLISASGKLMSEHIDAARLTFYLAPLTTLLLLPLALVGELADIRTFLTSHASAQVFLLLLLSCAVALAYNVVHNLVIAVFSSVTTTVLGQVKIVGILLVSAAFLGEARIWTPRMAAGVLVAFVGLLMYARVRRKATASLAGSSLADKLAATGAAGGDDDDSIQVHLLDAQDWSEAYPSPRPTPIAPPQQPVGVVVGGVAEQHHAVVVLPPEKAAVQKGRAQGGASVQVRAVKG